MNLKLIIRLSLFGLFMAVSTVYFIPSKIEPVFWLIIFLISAYFIAKKCTSKFFLHGFVTSLANCVWITSAHILLYFDYASHHTEEIKMSATKFPSMADHPRQLMLIFGPAIGIISGLVLGLFAFLANKILNKKS